jgi:RNA polymerase sigma factor (sigma-70 family)
MSEENEMLRRYAEEGSERDFAELTARYVDLVYSAAFRQVGGNRHSAEEVTQMVFIDLARKAGSLVEHPSLSGWLFTTTRYIAINCRRSEMRRQAREEKAQVMSSQESESTWEELGPALDEAMHDLAEQERQAVLLRFFERQPLSVMGQRWGITENAARMRVERAVGKLREILQRRGILTSATVLDALMTAEAVTAAPFDLARRISARTTAGAASSSLAWHGAQRLWNGRFLAVATGIVLVISIALSWPAMWRKTVGETAGAGLKPLAAVEASSSSNRANLEMDAARPPDRLTATPRTGAYIDLSTVVAETGDPAPDIALELATLAGEKWKEAKLTTSAEGLARIEYPEEILAFDLQTRGDGHANARLQWRPDRGEKIPARYTLRLTRPAEIGGTVVDPDGAPVAEAKVSFGHSEIVEPTQSPESHSYQYAETRTDAAGRWRMNRIAPEMLGRSSGGARHPDFANARVELEEQPDQIASLTNGTHVFRLEAAILLKGIVLNEAGEPVGGAKVRSDFFGSSSGRETTSGEDGRFAVPSATSGRTFLTAEAEGYAPTSIRLLQRDATMFHELRLTRGKTVRFRVIDPEDNGIEGAHLGLETMHPTSKEAAAIQIELTLVTDAAGRAAWTNAPDALLPFAPNAKGYMSGQSLLVHPSEQEYLVRLEYALTIRGNVRDSSGNPVPRYRIGAGWPERVYGTEESVPLWSDIDRYWLAFSRPDFEHTFSGPVLYGQKNHGYFFKFEAEGYVPIVTRLVDAKEREAVFDIVFEPEGTNGLRVVDAHGMPVPNAQVVFLREGAFVYGGPDGFYENSLPGGRGPLRKEYRQSRTDENGIAKMVFDPELTRVLIACKAGCVNLRRDEIPADGVVRLKAWGRIQGRVLRAGAPSAGETVMIVRPENLVSFKDRRGPLPSLQFEIPRAMTGEDGSFTLTNVPPGKGLAIVLRHRLDAESRAHGVHEWKWELQIEDDRPIEMKIELPESALIKPAM